MTEAQKQGLIEEFMPDVEGIVRDLDNGLIPFEDLMQEGYVGLVEGVNGIREDAGDWAGASVDEQVHEAIRTAVQRAIDEAIEMMRKDDRLIAQVELLSKSIDRLTEELGTKPDIDEIANDMGISQNKVMDIMKLAGEDTGEEDHDHR